jgi:hydrogenase/urease accessory protein HupE
VATSPEIEALAGAALMKFFDGAPVGHEMPASARNWSFCALGGTMIFAAVHKLGKSVGRGHGKGVEIERSSGNNQRTG